MDSSSIDGVMRLTGALRVAAEDLCELEGFASEPYKDNKGVWTIGHGITHITPEESYEIVVRRVDEAVDVCTAIFGVDVFWGQLNMARMVVLIEMVYQLGGFSKFPRFVEAVKAGEYGQAALEMLHRAPPEEQTPSEWFIDTPRRCELQAQRMRTGLMHP